MATRICSPQIRLVFSKLGTISIATLSSGSRKGKGKAGQAAWKVERVDVVDLPPEGVGDERFMGVNGWAVCSGAYESLRLTPPSEGASGFPS